MLFHLSLVSAIYASTAMAGVIKRNVPDNNDLVKKAVATPSPFVEGGTTWYPATTYFDEFDTTTSSKKKSTTKKTSTKKTSTKKTSTKKTSTATAVATPSAFVEDGTTWYPVTTYFDEFDTTTAKAKRAVATPSPFVEDGTTWYPVTTYFDEFDTTTSSKKKSTTKKTSKKTSTKKSTSKKTSTKKSTATATATAIATVSPFVEDGTTWYPVTTYFDEFDTTTAAS